jgi:hypothetical protein
MWLCDEKDMSEMLGARVRFALQRLTDYLTNIVSKTDVGCVQA